MFSSFKLGTRVRSKTRFRSRRNLIKARTPTRRVVRSNNTTPGRSGISGLLLFVGGLVLGGVAIEGLRSQGIETPLGTLLSKQAAEQVPAPPKKPPPELLQLPDSKGDKTKEESGDDEEKKKQKKLEKKRRKKEEKEKKKKAKQKKRAEENPEEEEQALQPTEEVANTEPETAATEQEAAANRAAQQADTDAQIQSAVVAASTAAAISALAVAEVETGKAAQERNPTPSESVSGTEAAPPPAQEPPVEEGKQTGEPEKNDEEKEPKKDKRKILKEKIKADVGSVFFNYIIIGNDMAAFSALKELKKSDDQSILVLTTDPTDPEDYLFPNEDPLEFIWRDKYPQDFDDQSEFNSHVGSNLVPREGEGEGGGEGGAKKEEMRFKDEPEKKILVARGYDVKGIMPYANVVILSNGAALYYDQCLISTGSSPTKLDGISTESPNVTYMSKKSDFEKLRSALVNPDIKHVTVVGGGPKGSDVVNALTFTAKKYGKKISHIAPSGVMGQYLPEYLSERATNTFRKEGIDIITGSKVASIASANNVNNSVNNSNDITNNGASLEKLKITLENGNSINTDYVVVCVGQTPNTHGFHEELFKKFEVQTEMKLVETVEEQGGEKLEKKVLKTSEGKLGGLVVNSQLGLRTDLWATGSVANHYIYQLKKRVRFEDIDNVNIIGRVAARNMLNNGPDDVVTFPMMYGKLGRDIYYGMGVVDNRQENVGVWLKGDHNLETPLFPDVEDVTNGSTNESSSTSTSSSSTSSTLDNNFEKNNNFRHGVVYYLNQDNISGILLWNMPGDRNMETYKMLRAGRNFSGNRDAIYRTIPLAPMPESKDKEEREKERAEKERAEKEKEKEA